jgi:predicted ATPase/DNA-binding CsgD family transcriptional regulator
LGALHNLPVELSSFVGRARELEELQKMLGSTRLLTLTGIGGAGKTRLALKLAASVAEGYPEGVWLVALGPVLEESLLSQAVASVLDIRERSGESLEASLARHLRDRRALLVLDGCEHLVDTCARLVELMLGSGRELTILTTSQEALRVPGELIWRAPSLSLPPSDGDPGVASLMESEAVRLFVARAALVQSGFTPNTNNGPVIARICRRLDGLPLAIELAAAQIRLMPLTELELRLQDRFRLLTGGSRTALARHQTLRATVDWSYDRLDPSEQALFRRLAVFSGTFDVEAAEAVCGGPPVPPDVLGCLSRLVDRSMVGVIDASGGMGRYQLLETLRQYGQERLRDNGDEHIRRRHAEYFATLAQKRGALMGTAQSASLAGLELDQDNLRAALTWALANDQDLALQLAAALGPYWYMRGSLTEGHEWLAAATAASSTPSPTLARALVHAGWVAYWQSDYERSRGLAEQGLAVARELGAAMEIGIAVTLLGVAFHMADEDFEAARRCYAEAYDIRSRLNDERGVASSLNNLALIEYDVGNYETAESLAEDALVRVGLLGDRRDWANGLDSLARIVLERGKYAEARQYHSECLALAQELGDRVDTADALDGLARVAIAEGAPERALTIAGAAHTLRDRIGYETPKPWRPGLQKSIDTARAQLTPQAASAAWDRGTRLSEQQAVLVALHQELPLTRSSPSQSTIPYPSGGGQGGSLLTPRELEIAALIAAGLSNKQLAQRLKISERTADAHLEHIRTKLDVHSRAQIAAWFTQNGLLITEASR